jgi:hypothetical protein
MPFDIPPEIAREFVRYMCAFHAESNPIKRDAIAAEARHVLLEHLPDRTKLRLSDVREMFRKMKDVC